MVRFVKNRAIGLCVASLLLAALSVSAQDQAEQTPSVGEIVKLMVGSYKGLKSYQHSGQWATEGQVGETPFKQEIPLDVTYAAGSRFKIVSSMWQIVCDGKQVTVYVPELEQYMVRELGPDFWKDGIAMTGLLPGGGMRPDEFFASEDPVAEYGKLVLEANVKGGETAGEYDCWLIEGHAKMPEGSPVQGEIPLKVWHRKQDGLVVQASADLTELAKAQMAAMGQDVGTLDSVVLRCTAGKIILDADLPEDAFVFQPPAGARKVDEFEMPEPAAEPQAELEGKPAPESERAGLEGKPAPDFQLSALDGSAVKLSELKGKVVVLDFWASWCPPCRQEMPELEELWQRVKDKDVLIFGVNQGETADTAGQAAKDFGVTFRILLDPNGATGDAYGVSGIPTVMVIDRAGVVRARHVGYRAGIGKELEGKIQGILGGQ